MHIDISYLNPDPDGQVQGSFAYLLPDVRANWHSVGHSKILSEEGLLFPRRLRRGVRKGEFVWGPLEHSRALQTLHNPRYSGTYVWGRFRLDKKGRRKTPRLLPQDQWEVIIPMRMPDTSAGHSTSGISSDCGKTLKSTAWIVAESTGEGPALLQGLVVCASAVGG